MKTNALVYCENEVVKYADRSLNTELSVIRGLFTVAFTLVAEIIESKSEFNLEFEPSI